MQKLKPQAIEINGTTLHYVERGSGEHVIFVHGGLGDYRTWLPQMATFGDHYHTISYSRRAFYPNPWPANYDASILAHAADLVSLIQKLHLGSAHLVANSYGGYICLEAAIRYPQVVRTLVLAEPPVQPILRRLPGGTDMVDSVTRAAWIPSADAFARGDAEEGVRRFLDGAVGKGTFDAMPERTRKAVMMDAPELGVTMRADTRDFMPDITCEEAGSIKVPTLLLRGGLSPHMYYMINDELARCIPHAEQAFIPGAAHVLNVQNPAEHDRVVLDFLERRKT